MCVCMRVCARVCARVGTAGGRMLAAILLNLKCYMPVWLSAIATTTRDGCVCVCVCAHVCVGVCLSACAKVCEYRCVRDGCRRVCCARE